MARMPCTGIHVDCNGRKTDGRRNRGEKDAQMATTRVNITKEPRAQLESLERKSQHIGNLQQSDLHTVVCRSCSEKETEKRPGNFSVEVNKNFASFEGILKTTKILYRYLLATCLQENQSAILSGHYKNLSIMFAVHAILFPLVTGQRHTVKRVLKQKSHKHLHCN